MTRLFELPVGQNHEFLLALQNQGFTLDDALDVIKDPSKAKLIVETLRSNPSTSDELSFMYSSDLYSLEEQKEILLRLNEQLPAEQQVPTAWITGLVTTSDHVQSVNDLEFFFVVPGTLEETWRFNRALILASCPELHKDYRGDDKIVRLDFSGANYEPGIHRVRINLVDGWVPGNDLGPSAEEARHKARCAEKKLAGAEVLGAYALHPKLPALMSGGYDLPGCNLAGLQFRNSDGTFNMVSTLTCASGSRRPALGWRRARLDTSTVNRDVISIAPSLV